MINLIEMLIIYSILNYSIFNRSNIVKKNILKLWFIIICCILPKQFQTRKKFGLMVFFYNFKYILLEIAGYYVQKPYF